MSGTPNGPSSILGCLPLSDTCAAVGDEAPSTWCGDNTRGADEEGETPSTWCGDNTHLADANKALWPL